MKITKIEIKKLSIPLPKPYKLSKLYGTLYTTEPVVVKVHTDEGICGYGETDPMPLFTGESPETVFVVITEALAPALIGRNPLNIAKVHEVMDGITKDMHLAKAAIDMACYDILGKFAGLPVCDILGGKLRDELPIMGSIGGGAPEKNSREALGMIEKGYKSIMIKIGGSDLQLDIDRTHAIRDAVGAGYPLIVDANQGWDVRRAVRYIKEVDSCKLELFEQPIAAWDTAGFVKIKEKTDMALSADESVMSLENAKILIKEKAVDVFSVKVSKNGGIYRTKEIINLAEYFGIDCLFNSMIEEGITQAASLALGASTKNLYEYGHAYFSPTRLEADITNFSDSIKNGNICVSTENGLGIEVLEDVVEKYCTKSKVVES
jgi:muconate cycloisomerase